MARRQMKCNMEGYVKSDRAILMDHIDLLSELFGNMKGDTIKLFHDKDNLKLISYNNDEGFTESDKKAVYELNTSGDNNETTGMRGKGIKMAIDHLSLDEEKITHNLPTSIYSLEGSTIQKCKIDPGYYCYEWNNCENDDSELNNYLKKFGISQDEKGSLFIIPLSQYWNDILNTHEDEIVNYGLKYFHRKILSNNKFKFYYNGQEYAYKLRSGVQPSQSKEVEIKIGTLKGGKGSPPTVFRVYLPQNDKVLFYKKYNKEKCIQHKLTGSEHFVFAHDNVEETETYRIEIIMELDWKNSFFCKQLGLSIGNNVGVHLVINGCCINKNAITSKLKVNKTGGNDKAVGKYNGCWGHPFIYVEPSSKTVAEKRYTMTSDKSSVKCTLQGNFLQSVISSVLDVLYPPQATEPTHEPAPAAAPVEPAAAPAEPAAAPASQRTSIDNFSPKLRDELYKENQDYHHKKHELPRCPCCLRLLRINFHAGHIKSRIMGGEAVLNNGLAICSKCNGNDIRNIVDMVKEEWGDNSNNYNNLIKYLKENNKEFIN